MTIRATKSRANRHGGASGPDVPVHRETYRALQEIQSTTGLPCSAVLRRIVGQLSAIPASEQRRILTNSRPGPALE